MAAKRKPDAAPDAVQELAAPAVLKRLQMDAAKFSAQIDDAEARLGALGELSPNAAETKDNREQIARVECELITARDNFGKTAKILLAYDRGVATERKDGEKIGVEEAREIFAQLMLTIDLALEQRIIADAQSAALCDSPEAFHKASADNWRAAKDGALASAKADGVLPKWLTV
jgi:hypothetical protein